MLPEFHVRAIQVEFCFIQHHLQNHGATGVSPVIEQSRYVKQHQAFAFGV
jgi:hypothetical protein